MISLLTDAQRSVRRSPGRHRRLGGATSALGHRDTDENGINDSDDGLAGEFDGDEPEDLLMQVQRSKSSVPVTCRTSSILHNPRVEREGEATSAARCTEQVGHLSFFRMPTDS